MKLNKTYQHDTFYTDFNELPALVQDFIIKESALLTDIEHSSYTGYKDMAILRHSAVINGATYDIEMNMGYICDDNGDDYENDQDALNFLDDLLSVIQIEHIPVYLIRK